MSVVGPSTTSIGELCSPQSIDHVSIDFQSVQHQNDEHHSDPPAPIQTYPRSSSRTCIVQQPYIQISNTQHVEELVSTRADYTQTDVTHTTEPHLQCVSPDDYYDPTDTRIQLAIPLLHSHTNTDTVVSFGNNTLHESSISDLSDTDSQSSFHSCIDRPVRPPAPRADLGQSSSVTNTNPDSSVPPLVCVVRPLVPWHALELEQLHADNASWTTHIRAVFGKFELFYDWLWGRLTGQQRAQLVLVGVCTTLTMRAFGVQ